MMRRSVTKALGIASKSCVAVVSPKQRRHFPLRHYANAATSKDDTMVRFSLYFDTLVPL